MIVTLRFDVAKVGTSDFHLYNHPSIYLEVILTT